MKKYNLYAFLTSLFLLFYIQGFASSEDRYEGKKIIEVEFEGLVKTELYSVKSIVETKPRSLFTQETIDQDIKALFKLELFDDIKVDVSEREDGLVVSFIFVELPTIRDIIIRGNKKVSDRAVKERILLKTGSVYREERVDYDVNEVVALFEERGFPNSMVTYEVKETKEKDKKTGERVNSVDLIFTIEQSKKLVIRQVNFSGFESINIEALKPKLKTKERGYLVSRGFFREDELELDKRTILRYYGSRGYIDAEIIKVDKNVTRNEERNQDEMILTIYVREGNQYTFGGVTISGNKIFTDDELYSLIDLKENSIFNQTAWETSVQSIRNLLTANGYIYSELYVEETKDTEMTVVYYSIQLKENNKAHVEKIFITGNDKTKRFVIAREIVIQEGEIFNSYKIQRSMDKLYNLQYFANVNFDVQPGSELGLVALIFDVEETRTGLFSFGLSYSTSGYGLALFEEVSANNFLGRGLRLYQKIEVGGTRQGIELGIDEPWLFNKPTSAGLSLSWSKTKYGEGEGDEVYTWNEGKIGDGPTGPIVGPKDEKIPDGIEYVYVDGAYDIKEGTKANTMEYTNETYKMAIRFGKRFASIYGVSSELGFSVFRNISDDIYEPTMLPVVPLDDSLYGQYLDGWPWYWKNYLSITGYRDTRDSTIFARRGTYLAQTFAFYGGPLGGYSNFLRLNTDMNANVPTFWNFILSGRLNFGFIYPWLGKPLVIDETDKIRVDCWNEGRGWQRSSQFGSLYAQTGLAELNFSLEHRFPIVERYLWGLTFFDMSNRYDQPKDFSINFKEFYYSVGLGVSLVVPGFPIRLYLTRRFKYDDIDNRWELVNSQNFLKDWDFVLAVAGFF